MYPIVFFVYLTFLYITSVIINGGVVIELLCLADLGERGVEQYY